MNRRIIVTCTMLLAVVSIAGAGESESTTLPPRRTRMAAPASAFEATETNQVLIDVLILRAQGNISGDTSATDRFAYTVQDDSGRAEIGSFIFFTRAEFSISDFKLKADETEWTWDEKKGSGQRKAFTAIGNPAVLTLLGETFEIHTGSDVPIEYFEKRPDGLFEHKKLKAGTGFHIRAKVETDSLGQIVFRPFSFQLRTIEEREPIEGVGLDVGKPILNERRMEATLSLEPDLYYGIMLPAKRGGVLFIRLQASFMTVPDAGEPGP